jgi:signal transduction histidine kinase
MTAARVTLRADGASPPPAEWESVVQTLEMLLTASESPADIATGLLASAMAITACARGAVVLDSRDGSGRSSGRVLASSGLPEYPTGAPIPVELGERPRTRTVPLRSGGRDFARILLLDVPRPSREQSEALEHVRLLGTILHPLVLRESLEEDLVEAQTLADLGQVVAGEQPLHDVLAFILYLAGSLTRGAGAALALPVPGSESFVVASCTGSLRSWKDASLHVPGDTTSPPAAVGQAVVNPTFACDPPSGELTAAQGECLIAPLHAHGERLGLLVVAPAEAPAPSAGAMDALRRVASFGALALAHARLAAARDASDRALRERDDRLEEARIAFTRQQERVLATEKLAGLGRITAGIAHEINSPLGGITNAIRMARGYVEEYRSSIDDPDVTGEDHLGIASDLSESLALADSAAAKIGQFVRGIKTQSRADDEVSVFDPAAEIAAIMVLLQHRLRQENVGVFTRLERGLVLTGSRPRFAVVVQNLITNAIDASATKPGEIWVRSFSRGGWLNLEVQDRGVGIPEDIRERVFEYLFTTKEPEKGTGLGLTMVRSIVSDDFGGELSFTSEQGRGTTFRVRIPLTGRQE